MKIIFIFLLGLSIVFGQQISHATEEGGIPSTDTFDVSPDNNQVVFSSNVGSTYDLWLTLRAGGDSKMLTMWHQSDEVEPSWSPDGSRIAFASTRGGSALNIWTISNLGADPVQLTTGSGHNSQPRYSPDGSTIVFVSRRNGGWSEIWMMKADGSGQHSVFSGDEKVSRPTWSPDGQNIVFVGTGPTGERSNLYRIRRDGTEVQQITFGNSHDWYPDWGSNDIVFSSDREGTQSIWLVFPDGSNLRRLTAPVGASDFDVRWDSVGSTVFVTRSSSNDLALSNIWSVAISGEETQITKMNGFLAHGDLNMDGKIDCADLAIVKAFFGKKSGQPGFDFRADVNGDGIVDLKDLTFVSRRLPVGTKCP